MKIDRSTYETYLIDYLDGNLPEETRQRVEQFLAANPDLAEEFEMAKDAQSTPESLPSIDKTNYYRSYSNVPNITNSNFEEFCIAYFEGDLDLPVKEKIEALIGLDHRKRNLFELHRNIHFAADPRIHFPGKNQLKKPVANQIRRYLYLAISGAAALFIGFFIFFNQPQKTDTNTQAVNSQTLAPPKIEQAADPDLDSKIKTSQREIPVLQKHPTNTATIQLAAADTNTSQSPGTVILASIEPLNIQLKNAPVTDQNKTIHTNLNYQEAQKKSSAIRSNTEGSTRVITGETVFLSAVQATLKGFNTLTENDLAMDAEQNRNGKITGIKIYADNFLFQRRFRNNQN